MRVSSARPTGDGATAFRLLSLVRAYARESMSSEQTETATRAWLDHYRSLARDASTGVRGERQLEWLQRLDLETEDLAAVARALLDRRELDDGPRTSGRSTCTSGSADTSASSRDG